MSLARLAAALADSYRIERELGAGGMATVYLAEDLKHHRKVAIKVLHPDLAVSVGVERFLGEIQVTANLQHPNILALFDSGAADGQAYFVMPFVEGETLRDRLQRERQLPLTDAIRIASGVAAALEYAHAHGVIHRDIKPENILLQSGQAVVADFGIALAVRQADGQRLTQTGMSLGTPHYMSPEQALGERALDARTDIYALGVLTYEMLAGEPPFNGPTAQAIVARVMTATPPSLTEQRSGVPPAIDHVIHRAMARVPADRFATAAEFSAALAEPMNDAVALRVGRAARWPVLVGAILVIALAVVAFLLFRRRAAPGRNPNLRVVAVLPFRNISGDTAQQYFSAGMTEEITTQLSRVAALTVLGRTATAQYDTTTDRLPRMASELGVGSVVDGSVRLAGDRVRITVGLTDVQSGQSLWSEQYDRQLTDLFAVQDDVARNVTTALQATLTAAEAKRVAHAPTKNMAAYQLYLRALDLHPQRRSENLTRAELLHQAIAMDSSFAGAYAQLARNQMFRSVAGERIYADSGFIAARKAIALDPELADGYFALGDLLGNQAKLSDARRAYLKALELQPNHDGAMADLANTYVYLGRFDEALDWALRSMQLAPRHPHGPYHVALPLIALDDDTATEKFLLASEQRLPTELRIQGMLVWLDLLRGRKEASLARAHRLVQNEPDNTEGPPILAEASVMLGASDAESLIVPLATRDPESSGQYFPESLRSMHALTLHRRGDRARAATMWQQAEAAARRSIDAGAENPGFPIELAAINAMQGRTNEAMDWLERGYRAGWKDGRVLECDPFFDSVRQEPRYRAVLASMTQEIAEMRTRARAAHPELFK